MSKTKIVGAGLAPALLINMIRYQILSLSDLIGQSSSWKSFWIPGSGPRMTGLIMKSRKKPFMD